MDTKDKKQDGRADRESEIELPEWIKKLKEMEENLNG